MVNRPLLYVAAGVGGLGSAALLLIYANAWWVSGLVTVSIGCWLAGVLYAIYTPACRRAAPLGALVCSFLYLLLACGPWFDQRVGPWLLTTRALLVIDTQLLGHPQPQPVQMAQPAASNWLYATGWNTGYTVMPQTAIWTPQQQVQAGSPTVVVGQWLFAWCAAAIGAGAAIWITRRARAGTAAATQSGGSPFAETAP